MGGVSGLTPGRLKRVRTRLVEFAEEMFEPMARKDQRRWGEVYLRGLMLDGKRKSIEPMAARLEDGDEQCLQQFGRTRFPHHGAAAASSTPGGRLTSLFEVVRELQQLLACWQGTCPTCRRRLPPDTPYLKQPGST